MYVDIAFNASCKEFKDSLEEVFGSARKSGVMPVVVGLDLGSSSFATTTAALFGTVCFVGIHPLHFSGIDTPSAGETVLRFTEDTVWLTEHSPSHNPPILLKDALRQHLNEGQRIAGIGECGLDYYRKDNRSEQVAVFKAHLELSRDLNLPYFFHCRSAFKDFIICLDSVASNSIRGVVHSFDGTLEEAQEFLRRGLYIGINGCSMRTEENVEVVRAIPIEKILLETDSPYCLIRKSYFCSRFTKVVKEKHNEPRHITSVAIAVANIKSISLDEVEKAVYKNTIALFPKIGEYIQGFIDFNVDAHN